MTTLDDLSAPADAPDSPRPADPRVLLERSTPAERAEIEAQLKVLPADRTLGLRDRLYR